MKPRQFDDVSGRLNDRADQGDQSPAAAGPEHLRTLSSQVDAIARGDFAAVLEQATEDVTLDVFAPPEFPFVRHATGAGAFRHALEHNFSVVTEQRPVVKEVFAEGDAVVMFARETGVLTSTGAHYDVEFVERFTFRDGRLAAVQIIAAHTKPVGD